MVRAPRFPPSKWNVIADQFGRACLGRLMFNGRLCTAAAITIIWQSKQFAKIPPITPPDDFKNRVDISVFIVSPFLRFELTNRELASLFEPVHAHQILEGAPAAP